MGEYADIQVLKLPVYMPPVPYLNSMNNHLIVQNRHHRPVLPETEKKINAAMQPGASIISPFDLLPPAPADAEQARTPESYSGSYTQDYFGTVRVETNATGLLLYAGHMAEPFFLAPYDGDHLR